MGIFSKYKAVLISTVENTFIYKLSLPKHLTQNIIL